MNQIKKTICYLLLLTTTTQLFCNDLWDYFSSWNNSAIANAISSTRTWIKQNPGKTTLAIGGLTAAGVACYLYKQSCNKVAQKEKEQIQQLDQSTFINDIVIYKWDGNERDLNDIATEANKDENFQWLAPDGRVKPQEYGNVYNIKNVLNGYRNRSTWIINIIRKNDDNQDFVGFIAFNTQGYIDLFLIRDIFRGSPNKYAELIINNTLDSLKKLGTKHATLYTKTRNQRARRFYEKLGFNLDWDSGTLTHYTKRFL